MLTSDNIQLLTEALNKFISCRDKYIKHIGKGTSTLNEIGTYLTVSAVNALKNIVPNTFKVKASIGTGKIARQPWIAIMHSNITISTRKGVYIAFLFTDNLDKVYLTLTQGVSNSNPQDRAKIKDMISPLIKDDHLVLKPKINDQKYGEAAICAYEWGNDPITNTNVFKYLLDFYTNYAEHQTIPHASIKSENNHEDAIQPHTNEVIAKIITSIRNTGLIYHDLLIKRFAYSLLTKPFVILSGLAGSGKTQLILAFAKTLVEDEKKQICVVSVGADWTNREPLLGYPNALHPGEYIRPESSVLDLLIDCNREENAHKPYFLILDEMNLSVVERYFSEFLSAMESHENINLWKQPTGGTDSTPNSIRLPKNLFIVGTINVDETTYMFSPKVLDRANVIEFKVSEAEMSSFLHISPRVDIQQCQGQSSKFASIFVEKADTPVALSTDANNILQRFFKELKKINAEFGYRTATEIGRFISLATEEKEMTLDDAVDAAIVQKLLPKLHGSRKKIVPVLKELWKLCGCPELEEMESPTINDAKYKLAADKVLRMYNCAIDNGFTSYAEA